jgi:hypothetical protein
MRKHHDLTERFEQGGLPAAVRAGENGYPVARRYVDRLASVGVRVSVAAGVATDG